MVGRPPGSPRAGHSGFCGGGAVSCVAEICGQGGNGDGGAAVWVVGRGGVGRGGGDGAAVGGDYVCGGREGGESSWGFWWWWWPGGKGGVCHCVSLLYFSFYFWWPTRNKASYIRYRYGLFNTAFAGGMLIGPLWAGFVVNSAGWATMCWSLAVLSVGGAVVSGLFVGGWVGRKGVGKKEGERGREREVDVEMVGGARGRGDGDGGGDARGEHGGWGRGRGS